MSWLFALIGAVVAAGIEDELLLLGALLGWLFGDRFARVKAQRELEERVRQLEARELAPVLRPQRIVPPVATPAAAPAPVHARVSEPDVELPPELIAALTAPPPPAPAPITELPRAVPEFEPLAAPQFRAQEPTPRPRPYVPAPPEPAEPGWLEQLLQRANWPVVMGGLMLFVGVGALLKYAVEQGWFTLPPWARVLGIAIVACAALGFAWRQREARRGFSLALQGVALGVLLIDIYAGLRLFGLLTAPTAFFLMVLVVALGVVLAVLQNAQVLALLSAVGGFAAPVLASTGSGNHVALFSYLLVLNAGVLGVAVWKRWPWLHRIGFVGTFVLGSFWGARYYQPLLRGTVEPFLLAVAAMYIGLALLSTRRSLQQPGDIDPGIVFATPLVTAVLLTLLWPHDDHALALHSLGAAVVYGGLWLALRQREHYALLKHCFGAFAFGFATIAIPLEFGARITSACYALEGAGLIWYAGRTGRLWPQWVGLLLQLGALVSWVIGLERVEMRPWVNGHSLGAVIALAAALASAWSLERALAAPLRAAGMVWFSLLWAVLGFGREVEFHGFKPDGAAWLLLLSLLAVAYALAALRWQLLFQPVRLFQALLPVLILVYAGNVSMHLLDRPHLWGIGPALLALVLAAWVQSRREALQAFAELGQYLWQASLMLSLSIHLHALASFDQSWSPVWIPLLTVAPWLLLALVLVRQSALQDWPHASETALAWRGPRELAVVAVLVMFVLWTLGMSGRNELRYLPLANPLEAAQMISVALIWGIARHSNALSGDLSALLRLVAKLAAFAIYTMVAVRLTAHMFNLPWDHRLGQTSEVQAALALAWSVLGVVAMVLGNRLGRRQLWLAGAALMTIVAFKLLLIDRRYLGSLAGIIAFIGVGGLLVAVAGFFAPAPPKEAA